MKGMNNGRDGVTLPAETIAAEMRLIQNLNSTGKIVTRCFYILFLFLLPSLVAATDLMRPSLSVDYGIWKPTQLDDEPSKPFQNVDGASYYPGGSVSAPFLGDQLLRLSYFQWKQSGLEKINLEYVHLRHLTLDVKYMMLPEVGICPFVSYGVAGIWSRQQPLNQEDEQAPLDRAGLGFDLGAGIDFKLSNHLALSVEYLFMYAMLSHKVGYTDNYSGPRLSGKLMLLF